MTKTTMFTNLKGNLFGGITAGVIALPLALAFGVASGLGAAAGLWGAIIVGLFASIFGGTATQISGPTGPMTVVIASLVLTYPDNPKIIFMAIFLAGLVQICLSFTGVAKLIHFVPYPVVSGFMCGIGIIIILLQLAPFLGLEASGTPIEQIFQVFKHLPEVSYPAIILSVIALAIIFLTPKKIAQYCPTSLLALVIGTVVSMASHFNVKTIGEIPLGLPHFELGLISFHDFQTILPLAVTLAVLGSIDSLLTCLVVDSITNTKHNSNRELVGQGIGNALAGMFGGLAGAGATMRTLININSGATGRLSGVVHSIFLICVVLFLAPFASQIPLAVLAAILIKVGVDIIDYKYLKVIVHSSKADILVMTTVFVLTVIDNLIFAVGVGIVLSAILFAVRASQDLKVNTYDHEIPNLDGDCKLYLGILHIDGMFFFGSASTVLARSEALLKKETIIVDCQKIKSMDISATFALETMISRLKEDNIHVIVVFNNAKIAREQLFSGLSQSITRHDITLSMDRAIEKATKYHNEKATCSIK